MRSTVIVYWDTWNLPYSRRKTKNLFASLKAVMDTSDDPLAIVRAAFTVMLIGGTTILKSVPACLCEREIFLYQNKINIINL